MHIKPSQAGGLSRVEHDLRSRPFASITSTQPPVLFSSPAAGARSRTLKLSGIPEAHRVVQFHVFDTEVNRRFPPLVQYIF